MIRFEDESGRVRYGDPHIEDAAQLQESFEKGSLVAKVLDGDDPFALKDTGDTSKVKKLLPILTPANVPIIKCIGLNYMKHSKVDKAACRNIH